MADVSTAANQTPKVSIVSVNYKMANFIRHLVQGIQDAKLPFSYECLIVDNGSQDGVMSMLNERFPWVKTHEVSKNGGFGFGNNVGIKQAKGEYIMLLNPDATVLPGQLEAWIEWMDKHPDIGISGPRLMNPDGSDQDSCYRHPMLLIPVFRRTPLGRLWFARRIVDRYLMKDMDRTVEQDVDWVLGAGMLIRRSVIEQVGMFDERFFMYFEDADLCRRAWQKGIRVTYTPAARIVHYHRRQSVIKRPWQVLTNPITRIHIASGIKYFWKYFGQSNPRPIHES